MDRKAIRRISREMASAEANSPGTAAGSDGHESEISAGQDPPPRPRARIVRIDGLVRVLFVVDADELIEPGLLLQKVLARGLGGFLLQRQVRAFIAPILLWMSGLDALDADP